MHSLNVGMIQLRECQGFLAKAFAGRFIAQRAGGQHLDRHIAPQVLIPGTVDHTHPPFANLLEERIVPEPFPNHGKRVLRHGGPL